MIICKSYLIRYMYVLSISIWSSRGMPKSSTEVMKWREAVEFLLRMATTGDPAKLREGDLINLIEDLRRYLELQYEVQGKKERGEARSNPAGLAPASDFVLKLATAAADHTRAEIHVGATQVVF